jgi:hypothetical protein
MPVVVVEVLDEDRIEVSGAEHEHSVQTLPAQGPDYTLAHRVCPGCGHRSANDLDTFSGEDGVPLNRPIIIDSRIRWIVWISHVMVLLSESR